MPARVPLGSPSRGWWADCPRRWTSRRWRWPRAADRRRAASAGAGTAFRRMLDWLFVPAWQMHLAGMLILAGSLAILATTVRGALRQGLADTPDAYADVRRHGLLPTLLLYWLRWRHSNDPPPCAEAERHPPSAPHPPPELLVVIQCESFADPVELFEGFNISLPGLANARESALQWGGQVHA